MKESKFHFSAYQREFNTPKDISIPTVSIAKNNQMTFGSKTLEMLGIKSQDSFGIRLYEDVQKRAIGFVFIKPGEYVDSNHSFIVSVLGRGKYKTKVARIGITSFIRRIGKVRLPVSKLPINIYNDTFFNTKMYYVTIPKTVNIKVESETNKS
jgi:hypothetical protein